MTVLCVACITAPVQRLPDFSRRYTKAKLMPITITAKQESPYHAGVPLL